MENIGAPMTLPTDYGIDMDLVHVKLTKEGAECSYQEAFGGPVHILTAYQIENKFPNRPKTTLQEIVPQGKYECGAAALAMLTGHSLFHVKRAMGMHGWRNDDSGAGYNVCREAVRQLGLNMIYLDKYGVYRMMYDMPDCVLTVPSLNYKGRWHAVTWLNGEILDPNAAYPGRKIYGPDWAPWTIGANGAELLVKQMSKIQYEDLMTTLLNRSEAYEDSVLEVAI